MEGEDEISRGNVLNGENPQEWELVCPFAQGESLCSVIRWKGDTGETEMMAKQLVGSRVSSLSTEPNGGEGGITWEWD